MPAAPAAAVAAPPPGSFRGNMPMQPGPARAPMAPAAQQRPALTEEEAPTVRLPPGQMSALAAASGAAAQAALAQSSQAAQLRAATAEQKKATSWVEDQGEAPSWLRGGDAPSGAHIAPAIPVDGAGKPLIPQAQEAAAAPPPLLAEPAPPAVAAPQPVPEDTGRAVKLPAPQKKSSSNVLILLGAVLFFMFLMLVGVVGLAFKMGWLGHLGGHK
jgi:hypothetical protein